MKEGRGVLMNVIGYIRVGSDNQDLQKQAHLLLKYAQRHGLKVRDFINLVFCSLRYALLELWKAQREK